MREKSTFTRPPDFWKCKTENPTKNPRKIREKQHARQNQREKQFFWRYN